MSVSIREAVPDDADAIAGIHVDGWREGYRGLVADELLESLSRAGREMTWREKLVDPAPRSAIFVAESEGEVVGFASCGPCRDEDLYQFDVGEIYALYVDPDRWRRGIGSELLRRTVDFLDDRDFDFMSLWVLADNDAARRFYERAGFLPDHTEKTEQHEGFELEQARYRALLT